MVGLGLRPNTDGPVDILCLGAHCDDIEIGCGGTIRHLIESKVVRSVTWVVFSSNELREREALGSAQVFLAGVEKVNVLVRKFRDGFFPAQWAEIKQFFEELKRTVSPDVIFTHYRDDRHQDHRVISDLTWNTFRNHFVLEYEIPKYDGDMGSPNVFVELTDTVSRMKVETLVRHYASQAGRSWFAPELFMAILRLRGMECSSASGYAEAFYGRKVVIAAARPA
jgi:LmbE family N-acetylglucosaminyl deacetylase